MNAPIELGDRVRSYDFDGRRDCYVEGFVTGFEYREGCERYAINVERVVWNDKDITPPGYKGGVFPPVNGTPKSFGGVCNGVEKIDERPLNDGGRPMGKRTHPID